MLPIRLISASLAFSCLSFASNSFANEWLLFSRHGECVAIDNIKKQLNNAPNIKTPTDLTNYFKSQKLQFEHNIHAGTQGEIHEFLVPGNGLAFMLVSQQQCNGIASRSR